MNKRTKFDAAISSGFALKACNRLLYRPVKERVKKPVNFSFAKFSNDGVTSKIIKN